MRIDEDSPCLFRVIQVIGVYQLGVPPCQGVGFDHGLLCRVKNMARGTQYTKTEADGQGFGRNWCPRAMVFTRHGRPRSNPIIARSLIDFFSCFIHIIMNFSALKCSILARFMVAREIALLLWTGCQVTQKNNCHENLYTRFTEWNGIRLNKILVAMENFEKCTVAMLGGPCSQHVTGNASRLYQFQSAIMTHQLPVPHTHWFAVSVW